MIYAYSLWRINRWILEYEWSIGLGKIMFEWVINRAKEKKAHLLQLTTDKKRAKAIKFYEDLGFKQSHEGIKKPLKL